MSSQSQFGGRRFDGALRASGAARRRAVSRGLGAGRVEVRCGWEGAVSGPSDRVPHRPPPTAPPPGRSWAPANVDPGDCISSRTSAWSEPLGTPASVGVRARSPVADGEAGSPPARYRCGVSSQRVPGGVVHTLPADLREALIVNTTALEAWKDITPLARNEFICWVEDAKQQTTRERRIRRTQEELEDGQRRPCCWPGCKHRDRTGR